MARRFGPAIEPRQCSKSPDRQRICATLGHCAAVRACALFTRVPINAAGSPPFVLPQDRRRPARPPPRGIAAMRLAVCRAGGLTGQGERTWTVTARLRPSRHAAISSTSPPARSARSAAPRSLVPLIAQMNPDASTIAAGAPIEVDLAPDRRGPGHQGVLARQADLHQPPHQERDRGGAQRQSSRACPIRSPTRTRVKQGHDQWLVLIGICTHLGCIPLAHQGALRRLVLPVPRLGLRHLRPHPAGPGAGEPARCRPTSSSPTPRSGSAKRTRPKS